MTSTKERKLYAVIIRQHQEFYGNDDIITRVNIYSDEPEEVAKALVKEFINEDYDDVSYTLIAEENCFVVEEDSARYYWEVKDYNC